MPITKKLPRVTPQYQSGNVLIMILIAVALLAALSFTITKSSQDQGNTSDNASAKILATQIVKEAAAYKSAWAKLQANGCSEIEITFEHPSLSVWLSNSRSPSDKSCHIFNPNGGAIQAPKVKLTVNGTEINWSFSGSRAVHQFGNETRGEILAILRLPYSSSKALEICNQINKLNEISYSGDTPPQDRADWPNFQTLGQYTPNDSIDPSTAAYTIGEGGASESNSTVFARKSMGCYTEGTTGNIGIVYAVIQSR